MTACCTERAQYLQDVRAGLGVTDQLRTYDPFVELWEHTIEYGDWNVRKVVHLNFCPSCGAQIKPE
ncbi:hypothetical protein BcepSauron_385 [Burkholderia phage BcepSauron]|uniref:Uncharacterized protein n=2 Tax=Sarumanvirus TaxID=2843450 RepID=A0A482MM60_9CAUD|nr:hypothetical protein H1O16_gp382 [Burkholderia phage BcepSaruman]YP_009904763.1 hypothetical protein H1O17_gp385 [Burkholderia phage BcepSauron]QBQ74765.1 hypothetical protein BcepSauron_385 [Burkholderia phage BcepSauron]QBX06795.1 hypothetical protein BcepSaruman_382 [Burkholderia phage BcepSaruman]